MATMVAGEFLPPRCEPRRRVVLAWGVARHDVDELVAVRDQEVLAVGHDGDVARPLHELRPVLEDLETAADAEWKRPTRHYHSKYVPKTTYKTESTGRHEHQNTRQTPERLHS